MRRRRRDRPDRVERGPSDCGRRADRHLATGQSNFVQTPAFAWSPESAGAALELQPHRRQYRHRLRRAAVDHDQCYGQVRVRSRAAQSDAIGLSDQYGDGVLRQQDLRWLPGIDADRQYLQITNNVPAALAAIGATKIDLLLWWQGEAQIAGTSLPVSDRLGDLSWPPAPESWFPWGYAGDHFWAGTRRPSPARSPPT